MSATVILNQRDAVHILTDGAGIDADGRMVLTIPKCNAVPQCNAAIAIRGPTLGLPLITELMSGAASFDELKRTAPKLLREAIVSVRAMTARPDLWGEVQLFVGGWSSKGPSAFTVLSAPDSGLPAWEVIDLPEHSFSPFTIDGPIHSDVWDIFAGRSVNELDPRVDGLAILEAQRRHAVDSPIGRHHIVGGFAQLTTVRRDSISTEILRRWSEDQIGHRINPNKENV